MPYSNDSFLCNVVRISEVSQLDFPTRSTGGKSTRHQGALSEPNSGARSDPLTYGNAACAHYSGQIEVLARGPARLNFKRCPGSEII